MNLKLKIALAATLCICSAVAVSACRFSQAFVSSDVPAPPSQSDVINVMTYNIRYGAADDGPNSWPARKAMLIDLLKHHDADIMGFQEALDEQVQQIQQALPQYSHIMIGRSDGKTKGESCAIFYKKNRFALADADAFWFSNTPAVPGSKHWGNSITRMCTRAHLIDTTTGGAFYVYNLHLDHRSQPSRAKSARLLAEEISRRTPEAPFIVMGDFNAGLDNPALQYLIKASADTPCPVLVDAWQAVHPDQNAPATFNGFRKNSIGPKIDHILVPPDVEIISAGIDRRAFDGRFPSDHFPVYATVRLPQ